MEEYEEDDVGGGGGGGGGGAERGLCSSSVFRSFVCVALSVLLGLHVYSYLWGREGLQGDFSDIKYVVMQLTRGLSEVNRKHERLQSEMERVSSALPAVAAAAGRAREALGPSLQGGGDMRDMADYDRQEGQRMLFIPVNTPVPKRINKFYADEVAGKIKSDIADYALESAGARVLDTGETVGHFNYESMFSWAVNVLTSWVCRECQSARAIIQPGTLPGQCWAFKGSSGEATIRLLGTIYVTGVSVEHIPAHIDPTKQILAAPRLIQLEGLRSRSDTSPHNFGTFEYDKDGSPIQYFEVVQQTPRGFNIVRVRVLSNWGHPVYTCLYRVRVHGDLLPGQTPRNSLSSDDEIRIDSE